MNNINSLNNLNSFQKGGRAGFGGPKSIAGLTFWLDITNGAFSDAGITPCVNGDRIQQWNDLSGVGGNMTQATSGQRPFFTTNALNGLPSARFDGSNDLMVNTTFPSGNNATTIFAVIKGVSSISGQFFFSRNNVTAGVYDGGGPYNYFSNSVGTGISIGGNVASAAVITLSYADSTSLVTYINGTANAAFDPDDQYTVSTGFTLGSTSNAGGSNIAGDIYEIIVYNTALNTVNRNAVHSYLGTKWGITMS